MRKVEHTLAAMLRSRDRSGDPTPRQLEAADILDSGRPRSEILRQLEAHAAKCTGRSRRLTLSAIEALRAAQEADDAHRYLERARQLRQASEHALAEARREARRQEREREREEEEERVAADPAARRVASAFGWMPESYEALGNIPGTPIRAGDLVIYEPRLPALAVRLERIEREHYLEISEAIEQLRPLNAYDRRDSLRRGLRTSHAARDRANPATAPLRILRPFDLAHVSSDPIEAPNDAAALAFLVHDAGGRLGGGRHVQ